MSEEINIVAYTEGRLVTHINRNVVNLINSLNRFIIVNLHNSKFFIIFTKIIIQ